MSTRIYALPLPPPFTRTQQPPQQNNTDNQYIIQLTIPTSNGSTEGTPPPATATSTIPGRQAKAKPSIMIWAGIGRVKPRQVTGSGREGLDAYQRALAEEMDDSASGSRQGGGGGGQVECEFEGLSRKLGDDWACAMPSTLQTNPVASSNLLIGIEADTTSDMGAKSGRARRMAERLAKRFHSQIFLSLDIPHAISLLASLGPGAGSGPGPAASLSGGGMEAPLPMQGSRGMGLGGGVPGMDPLGDQLYLGLEKALVEVLGQVVAVV
ncbi:hypothetical protein QFC21_000953 [Naganishia friedmannii]|uniref:Uncharacterized protein n=1 Tax=Naganishia friedmannii TaxID=89922 RepID=A0ACC2W711_9TREE|nr:hypothetical protein QFC21_000953 [Naganishia friedmannii]